MGKDYRVHLCSGDTIFISNGVLQKPISSEQYVITDGEGRCYIFVKRNVEYIVEESESY